MHASHRLNAPHERDRNHPRWERAFLAISLAFLLCAPPAGAFDTFWHSAATSAATRQLGFTDDSTNMVQFGNFSGPDFFGPLYDTILGEKVEGLQPAVTAKVTEFFNFRQALPTLPVRKFAIFMHFDNLHYALSSNAQFDLLFTRLLANTQKLIRQYFADSSIGQGHQQILILMTLGASLHMVQDFYSHSDWIHFDFPKMGIPLSRLPWGKDAAPTWFAVKAKLGDPDKWPFRVSSGVYPPSSPDPCAKQTPSSPPKQAKGQLTTLGVPMEHSCMNHDNSQLIYEGLSQIARHNFGPFPATDENSAREHQLFAVNTAASASIEWIWKLMEDPAVRSALDFARSVKLGRMEPRTAQLASALASTLFMSCVAKKWDGPEPPQRRITECNGSFRVATGTLPSAFIMPGIANVIPSPLNEFWGMHTKYNIVEHLAQGFGNQSGDYVF